MLLLLLPVSVVAYYILPTQHGPTYLPIKSSKFNGFLGYPINMDMALRAILLFGEYRTRNEWADPNIYILNYIFKDAHFTSTIHFPYLELDQ